MLLILLALALLFILFKTAQLRGLLFGLALTSVIAFLLILSRFHLRKSMLLLASLFITAMILRLWALFIKSRKR